MRIAITGATGLLGRNLLFEIIKQNLDKLDTLKIFILGRSKDKINIRQRIHQIILKDGLPYLSITRKKYESLNNYFTNGIEYIDMDLNEQRLNINTEDLEKLKSNPIDFFFHIAALTDFRYTSEVLELLKKTNVNGTKQVIELISALKVREFCYTGTAYSCGVIGGNVKPDHIDLNQRFRNPYEKSKLEAEVLVRNFAKNSGIRCRYFRPSTICGRLIEAPLGATNKFDVFYSWAAFFLYMKLKKNKSLQKRYIEPLELNARIWYSTKSGLNIVPADYAAKVMYQVCIQNAPGESYFLVNNEETPHTLYIPLMLNTINVKGVKQVNYMPEEMNQLERIYYKTVGRIFTPYIISEPIFFDDQNISNILKKANLNCPHGDRKNFSILLDYAKQYDFGLK